MAGKQLENCKMLEQQRLRERAINCRRLAIGAGDPQFSLMLTTLAREYEAKAVQADAGSEQPAFGTRAPI